MTVRTTRRTTALSRLSAVAAVAVAGTLVLTGCGDQTKKDDAPSPSGSAAGAGSATTSGAADTLFSKLPQKYQDSKVIQVGTDASYAPMEQTVDGKIVGIDPDLGAALGEKLGVTLKFTNGKFDGLITSLQTGRSDIVMSAMSDTKARQGGLDDKGKKIGTGVDFVDYYNSGSSLLVQKGNPKGVKSLDDLCGQTVAVQRGTIYEDAFKKQKTTCGSKGLTIQAFDTDAEAQTRVKAGGAVADLNDTPVAAYIAQTSGKGADFEVAGAPSDAGPFGIAVSKDATQLRDALKAAMDAIVADGTYTKILQKWNATTGAVTTVAINGGS
ncbi:ABC transporter substrate-binding protein [Streptomyces cocklensis]|uniref:Amino acid ABC transporter substrate-binding protein, PAAT family n=1 Tax=Actinacidiphila cocklensis TaxID=887465 RepID=A0A9W4GSF7_9ACTN|nr:ABC transporter substrate-binding protein [Actinacidiphila cocklensis]MDD1061268.1 ABC transporter substrate-binding protein [Actinacidiphila cocklensis]WSX76892.1 ABC transporter substrate-binding protein [Streptomyces sp. NBC_00899]CAG6395829.1 Amino acid ABC transporter substrate-binding protein, PAAT family [Actinacidiphila cocklensis]